MTGVDAVLLELDRQRLKVSRLIDLERIPRKPGQTLLSALIKSRDLAQGIVLQEGAVAVNDH